MESNSGMLPKRGVEGSKPRTRSPSCRVSCKTRFTPSITAIDPPEASPESPGCANLANRAAIPHNKLAGACARLNYHSGIPAFAIHPVALSLSGKLKGLVRELGVSGALCYALQRAGAKSGGLLAVHRDRKSTRLNSSH